MPSLLRLVGFSIAGVAEQRGVLVGVELGGLGTEFLRLVPQVKGIIYNFVLNLAALALEVLALAPVELSRIHTLQFSAQQHLLVLHVADRFLRGLKLGLEHLILAVHVGKGHLVPVLGVTLHGLGQLLVVARNARGVAWLNAFPPECVCGALVARFADGGLGRVALVLRPQFVAPDRTASHGLLSVADQVRLRIHKLPVVLLRLVPAIYPQVLKFLRGLTRSQLVLHLLPRSSPQLLIAAAASQKLVLSVRALQ